MAGHVIAFREDTALNFVEYNLDGKPWSSPKSANTEKLILDILSIIYANGFSFLSNIDYGRENDDRLVMVFSAPTFSAIIPGSVASGSPFGSPNLANGSGSSLNEPSRVPFALSFPSASMVRVVSPPLHLTPAILAGVRGYG